MRTLIVALILSVVPSLAMAQQGNSIIYGDDPLTYQPPRQTVYPASSQIARPVSAPAAHHNWTDCYIGVYAGGAFTDNVAAQEAKSTGGAFAPGTPYNNFSNPYGYSMGSAFAGGATAGCSDEIPVQWGAMDGVVLGLEGEVGNMDMVGSGIDPNNVPVNKGDTQDKTTLGQWDGILAGRIGAAFNRTLIYGKVGAFFSEAKSSLEDSCSVSPCGPGTIHTLTHQTLVDPAFGAGIEYALSPSWSLKGEYMYLDTDDSYKVCGAGGAQAAGSTYCSDRKLSGINMVKVGLNYHFNSIFGGKY